MDSRHEKCALLAVCVLLLGTCMGSCTSKTTKKKKKESGAPNSLEVAPNLRRLAEAAKHHFETFIADNARRKVKKAPRFPASTVLFPPTPCHVQKRKMCQPIEEWRKHGWAAHEWGFLDPHFYRYQLLSSGEGAEARFLVRAVGWNPKTKAWVVYERKGSVTSKLDVVSPDKVRLHAQVTNLGSLDAPSQLGFPPDPKPIALCKAYGFLPKLSPAGVPLTRGKIVPEKDKDAAHCQALWRKNCGQADFGRRHTKTCGALQ